MTAPVARRGFTDEAIQALIARRAEPDWMRERRLEAWRAYEAIPMPARTDEEWRRTDLSRLRLDEVEPFTEGSDEQGTLVPPAERSERFAGFLGFRDARRVEYSFDKKLAESGVIFTDLATAVREHPDFVREYFMT